jgi:hypothetical protein
MSCIEHLAPFESNQGDIFTTFFSLTLATPFLAGLDKFRRARGHGKAHGVSLLERPHQRRVFERNSVVKFVFTAEA